MAKSVLRKANLQDVKKIQRLVNFYARKNMMLQLSLGELYDRLRDFFVYEAGGKVVGCGAMHIVWNALGEIRSLAVQKNMQKKRVGTAIVKGCLSEAEKLGLKQVFVLTYEPAFFKRFGFREIDKYELPHKVWSDCIKCVHFPDCDEDALVKDI